MALLIEDRILETSTTTGTGALTLAGAVSGFRTFASVMTSPSDTCFYLIEGIDANGAPNGEWETGYGTYSAANTLTRTTVDRSSNSNAAVNFSVGTKRVSIAQNSKAINVVRGSELVLPQPKSATFTLDNAGTATVTDVANGILLTAPANATSGLRVLRHTAGPASFTSFTLIMKFAPVAMTPTTSYTGCIFLRNTTSGKIVVFGDYQRSSQIVYQRWSSYTVFSANISGPTTLNASQFPWRKVVVAAGAANLYVSPDGINWDTQVTETISTYLSSIDQVGIGAFAQTGDWGNTVFTAFSLQ